MRVTIATNAPRDPFAAVYRYYSLRAEWLEAAGHEVEVVVPRDLPRTSATKLRYWPFVYPKELFRRIESSSTPPDVAIFHSFSGWATALRHTATERLKSLKVVTQFHGLEPLHHQAIRDELRRVGAPMRLRTRVLAEVVMPRILRLACQRSDLVLCLNSRELSYLEEHKWVKPGRALILPNQVEESFFIERSASPRCHQLLFIGQWQEGKGTRYLAAAFAELALRHTELVLSCVGTRAEADLVRRDFPEACRERVRVVPGADRGVVAEELRRADVFLFPSLSEGFSLALLEAMAAGLPIVCTPVGAAPDLLTDRTSALFVPPGEVNPLIASVESFLSNSEMRTRLGDAAAAAARRYSIDVLKPRFVELLENLVRSDRT